MPGYVMHLAEERLILDKLNETLPISKSWEQRFRTGTLLPDTKLREEKPLSHFWKQEEAALLTRLPDLNAFTGKYAADLRDPLVFGYLAHLHLDLLYLRDFWPSYIRFYNADGQEEPVREKVTSAYVLKKKQCVPIDDFFSPAWYYGEYGKLNYYFVDRYKIALPDWKHVGSCTVEEVDLNDLAMILEHVGAHLQSCRPGDDKALQIFDREAVDSFIAASADTFMKAYGNLITEESLCGY